MRGFCASLSMLLLAFGLGGSFDAARAQAYPNRNITLVVPFRPEARPRSSDGWSPTR
jgi:hypothetical protein